MHFTRLITSLPISVPSGANTYNTLFPEAIDLSHAKVVEALLSITSAATVVGSTLDVKLQLGVYQDAAGNTVWDTRGRFDLVPGNTAATVASPYMQGLNISQDVDLQTTERAYRPTGSNGGTELNSGTVRDGNFLPFFRARDGLATAGMAQGLQRGINARMQLVVVDAAASGAWTGRLDVYGHFWDGSG